MPGSSPGDSAAASDPAKRRGASGPRSWSQKRTGTLSCRIAETFFSLRCLRFAASASALSDEGNVMELTTTVPDPAATSTWSTPPARVATTRASPPSAGSSQSRETSSSSSSEAGSGRAEVNSSEPSGRNAAPPSPFALRVRRRAGRSPAGSTSHSAVTHLVRLGFSVWTAVTSRLPSGDSRSPAPRGRST